MINGKTVLGIIPARGGSKGIPNKNIKLLANKPLIGWTIEEAKKSKYIDRLILSSDDDEIIKISKGFGCEVPFKRPKELADDNTPGIEPVIHAINTITDKYDFVCLLQPTSPLRRSSDIDGCIEKCIYEKAESCISVTEVDQHPYWMYKIGPKEKLTPFIKNDIDCRQDLPKIYIVNGAIYFISCELIVKSKKLIFEDTIGFKMKKDYSIDIDDQLDFKIAEFLQITLDKI
jgi:N-acylneuraminate cytidylyltransferase